MRRRRIIGGILLLFLFVTPLLLPKKTAVFLITMILGTLVIAFLYRCLLPSRMECDLKLPAYVEKNARIIGQFQLTHHGYLPIFCGQVRGNVENMLTGETFPLQIDIGVLGREEGRAPFVIRPYTMGIYTVRVEQMDFYGLLGCAKKKISLSLQKECMVMPATVELSCLLHPQICLQEDGEDILYTARGIDPTMYQGVRLYQEGDPMKKMHWKLTGKTGEYYIKEMGEPAREMLLLLLDTTVDAADYQRVDSLLEAYFSLSQHLAEEQIAHCLGWWDTREKQWKAHRVRELSELDESLDGILRSRFQVESERREPEEPLPLDWAGYQTVFCVTSRRGWEETLDGTLAEQIYFFLECTGKDTEHLPVYYIPFAMKTMRRDLNRLTV